MTVKLAQAIGNAAARNGTGIVRSSMIGTGHDVCSSAPFVAGYHPPRNPGWPGPETPISQFLNSRINAPIGSDAQRPARALRTPRGTRPS